MAQLCRNVAGSGGMELTIGKWDKLNADMAKRTPKPPQPERTHVTSGINLPVEIYELLNRVAFVRSLRFRGRPSVSALIVDLVQQHRKELEKELEQ
jgi:hypothetical protein